MRKNERGIENRYIDVPYKLRIMIGKIVAIHEFANLQPNASCDSTTMLYLTIITGK